MALAMLILGIGILGNLNTKATSQESLGLAYWRVILSAGILAMIMSVVNVASVSSSSLHVGYQILIHPQTFLFADSDNGVSARHVREYGAVAPQKVVSRESSRSRRSFKLNFKRHESLPTYSSHSSVRRSPSVQNTTRFPLKISRPLQRNNDGASSKYSRDSTGVAVPNLAHHPAMYSNRV